MRTLRTGCQGDRRERRSAERTIAFSRRFALPIVCRRELGPNIWWNDLFIPFAVLVVGWGNIRVVHLVISWWGSLFVFLRVAYLGSRAFGAWSLPQTSRVGWGALKLFILCSTRIGELYNGERISN